MNYRTPAAIAALAVATGAGWWTLHQTDAAEASAAVALPAVASTFTPTMSEVDVTNRQIAFHEKRIEGDPRAATDRAALAALYLQRSRETGEFEDFRRAEDYARQSLAIRSKSNSKAFRMLSASLLAQHRFVEALEVAEELVRIWPEDAAHRALLAEIQMELGDYERAKVTLGSLESAKDDLSVAPRFARWAQITGRTAEEREFLYRGAERTAYRADLPSEQVAWYHLRVGEHELHSGRLDEAEKAFRAGLAVEPNDFRLVSALVRLEAQRGNWEMAIEYGELVGDAADLRTLGAIGDAHARLGDRAAAERYYRKVEESAAGTPEPYNRQLYQFRLDHDRKVPETLAILRKEIEERKDVLGYDLLAWALYRSGDYAAARDAMSRALRMGTEDANFYFHAGLIEEALGNRDAARAHLKKALKINPNFHPLLGDEARAVLEGR